MTGRFRVVFGNDVKSFALRTFELNHTRDGGAPLVLRQDIRTVSDREIANKLEAEGISNLDCLIGGPPCQGFSQMRRSEERRVSGIVRFGGYNKLDQDPRNDLVLRFLEVAAALRPKVVVIENVPQFLSHHHDGKRGGIAEQVEAVLEELGYHVSCGVVNAADFGVPQIRLRAVIVASRIGQVGLPEETHSNPEELLGASRPWTTVRDAIGDLPLDPPVRDALGGSVLGNYGKLLASAYARLMRTSKAFPFNHVTRNYQRRILQIIREMQAGETWDKASERMQGSYAGLLARAVSAGETEAVAQRRLEAEGAIIPVFYKRYYWSAYTRLSWTRPALTITANANFLGSGRFTHPERDRGITMREVARLQSFDDAFTFYTPSDPKRQTENSGVGMDMSSRRLCSTVANPGSRRVSDCSSRRIYFPVAQLLAFAIDSIPAMNTVKEFVVGERYSNDQIRYTLNLENLGGIRPSVGPEGISRHVAVMTALQTTRRRKQENPYEDRIEGDILTYTASGKAGDQTLTGKNRRLLEQYDHPVPFYGFANEGRQVYQFLGLLELLRHYRENQVDKAGCLRCVWVFELRIHPMPRVVPIEFASDLAKQIVGSTRRLQLAADAEVAIAEPPTQVAETSAFMANEQLRSAMLEINPYRFEILLKELLEKRGFRNVKVTPPSRDGGLDLSGIVPDQDDFFAGTLVQLQAKRWRHAVGSVEINSFRGALHSAAKGVFVTTSHYTKAALQEGVNPAKPTIALIDGFRLASMVRSAGVNIAAYA
jgi:DNA-cytosine methyltransferase